MARSSPLIALAGLALAACSSSTPPTTENAARSVEADLVNQAAALDANVNAEANRAAAAAIAEATAQAAAAGNSSDAVVNAQ
ncbi:MAG: hypothetical protein J0I47_04320 [Sphingomonas sp.]|uniref:hypothetical protein n=1 Tax=Sphingomonas sp. TaxID=28214 RepID=UPI001ACF1DAF|nr:hypothetical protein [Sphingomonas sp.]MBN8807451.1 hypothetical protein [Sphingomonas sp.]